MMEKPEDPLQNALQEIIRKREETIAAHVALRASPGFANATRRTETLVLDYALALHAVSIMSTRSATFGEARLSVRMFDLLIESALSTMGLIRDGLLNSARREMRFLLEASVKAWWCDAVDPASPVATKVAFLDDLGSTRFRDVVEMLQPRLIDKMEAANLLQVTTNLYAQLSTHVHASAGSIGMDFRRFQKGQHVGFEKIGDVDRINDLFTQVLDISLAAVFESFDAQLLGDIFVSVLDDAPRWSFHRTPLVRSISSHYDYKFERSMGEPD